MTVLYVAVGGALGAVMRYLTIHGVGRIMGMAFPYGTLMVNITGSLLMGVLIGWLVRAMPEQANGWRLFIGVGILGGFTTFSAFSLEAINLFERGALSSAILYILASVILSLLALIAGLWLVRVWPL